MGGNPWRGVWCRAGRRRGCWRDPPWKRAPTGGLEARGEPRSTPVGGGAGPGHVHLVCGVLPEDVRDGGDVPSDQCWKKASGLVNTRLVCKTGRGSGLDDSTWLGVGVSWLTEGTGEMLSGRRCTPGSCGFITFGVLPIGLWPQFPACPCLARAPFSTEQGDKEGCSLSWWATLPGSPGEQGEEAGPRAG